MRQPSGIFDLVSEFWNEEACIARLAQLRWPNGFCCIRCSGVRVRQAKTLGKTGKVRHLYLCRDCRYQYSVTTGTIFHNSHLPLTKWFLAIYLICVSAERISVKKLRYEL